MAADSFWWTRAETARELARRIAGAGDQLERLEIRIDRTRRGDPMTFRVVLKEGDAGVTTSGDADLNDSWLCPPICPGGGGGG